MKSLRYICQDSQPLDDDVGVTSFHYHYQGLIYCNECDEYAYFQTCFCSVWSKDQRTEPTQLKQTVESKPSSQSILSNLH